jgi:ketosteroid isomerase-like protein
MKTHLSFVLALAFALAGTSPWAHEPEQQPTGVAARLDVPVDAHAAVAAVDAFAAALAKGDFEAVEAALAPEVIVLEGGGAERSRAEYLDHHARSDAAFLATAEVVLMRRVARVDGGTAWVASESEMRVTRDGKPATMLSTETMVLSKSRDGWKIVHIHWSSRPKKDG